MTVNELKQLINAEDLTGHSSDREITSGMSCDLLSWVMAGGKAGMAWVTVQTHLNVVAVAALHDIACIVLPENIKMEGAPLEKANQEGVTVLSSALSAYHICGLMFKNGVE